MRIWFLTSNFQKLSETETAMEKFHHKKKKNTVGSFGEDNKNVIWKTHIRLFLTHQVLGKILLKTFLFLSDKNNFVIQ